jgi:hypothetical protein
LVYNGVQTQALVTCVKRSAWARMPSRWYAVGDPPGCYIIALTFNPVCLHDLTVAFVVLFEGVTLV